MADDKLVTHLVLDGVGNYMRGLSRVEYGLSTGAKAANDFRKRTEAISQAADQVGAAGTKMALAGGAMLAGLGAAGGIAARFDKAMRNVNTIAKLNEGEFQALRQSVLGVAADPLITDGPSRLAAGLYSIYSAGLQGGLAMKVLELSAKGGAAGMADTETASRALVAIMSAYNQKTIPDAVRIMDVLFKTVERGIPPFEEVANSIGVATNVAAAAGVPLEDVAAAFSVMTRRGIDASMTTTSLARIMTTMMDAPPELAARIKSLTGETGASILRTRGLTGAIDVLGRVAGNNPEVLAQIGIEMRALRAAMALTGDGAQEFAQDLAYMRTEGGNTQKAVEEQAKSQAHGWEQLRKTLEIVGIAFGDVAAGPMNNAAKSLAKMLQAISALPTWLKRTAVYLVGGSGIAIGLTGLALKLGATTVQTYLSVMAARAYWIALNREKIAAGEAASANATLAASRMQAAEAALMGSGLEGRITGLSLGRTPAAKGKGGWGIAGGAASMLYNPATIGVTAFGLGMVGVWKATVSPEFEKLRNSLGDLTEALEAAKAYGILGEKPPSAPSEAGAFMEALGNLFGGTRESESGQRFRRWAESPIIRMRGGAMLPEQAEREAATQQARLEAIQAQFEATGDPALVSGIRKAREELMATVGAERDLLQAQGPTGEQKALEMGTKWWGLYSQSIKATGEEFQRISESYKNWQELLKASADIASKTGDWASYSRAMDDLAGSYWDQSDALGKQGDQLGSLQAASEAINAQEERRKTILDQQTKAIQDQLGLVDAQVGYAQAYADYLEAAGRRGLARQYRREAIAPMQERAAWEQMAVGRQYWGMGMQQQGLQVGAQAWRTAAEAIESRRGSKQGVEKLTINPNWSFDRLQRDQDETVSMRAAAGM